MRIRLTLLLLIAAVCLVSCASPNQKLTLDEVHARFDEGFAHFETTAEIFSAIPEFREYLRDGLHPEYIYTSFKGMAHDDEVFLGFVSADELERAESSCRSLAPESVAYTALNMWDSSGFIREVEAIEFIFRLHGGNDRWVSTCSVFYVSSDADREFIAENPYRFYGGTTLRLNALDKEGWYIFVSE